VEKSPSVDQNTAARFEGAVDGAPNVEKSPSVDQTATALFQPVRWPVGGVLLIDDVNRP
jgi:hypothetical protein